MDSKLTKKRLSNFFQYEWIIMAIVVAVAIILMELLYTVLSVRLSVGQSYKIYYDENVSANGRVFENSLHYGERNSVFSYDVLDFSSESLNSDYNVLSTRLSVYEGDIIFSDTKSEEETPWDSRANYLVDNGYACSYEKLLKDAKTYLNKFLKEGETVSIENLDEKKIGEHFLDRQRKDNRFRSQEEKEAGKKLETERIKNLVSSYLYFEKAYSYGLANDWFYQYTKYEYFSEYYKDDKNADYYQKEYETQKNEVGQQSYGLIVSQLNGEGHIGEHSAEDYVKLKDGSGLANGVVLMVFDFISEQPDLQFESIAVINSLIKNCSGFNEIGDIPTV